MKFKFLLAFVLLAIVVSIYFTYQRSFVWKNFDIVNSDEESGGTMEAITPADDILLETSTSKEYVATTTGTGTDY